MNLHLFWPKVGITLVAMATIPAVLYFTNEAIANRPVPTSETSQVMAQKVKVRSIEATTMKPSIEVFGEVIPAEQMTLPSQVSGAVVWRNPSFETGGLIAAGESLVRIDNSDQVIALASAEEALASAQMNLQQEQRQAKHALQDWQRSGIDQTPPATLLREDQVAIAKASLKTATAQLKQAQKQLYQTDIKAPFASLISQRHVSVGSMVSVGAPIADLQYTDTAHIDVAVSEAQWQHLKHTWQQSVARIQLPMDDQVNWTGKVTKLANNIDTSTRMRNLTVAVEKPLEQTEALLFGSFVQVTLQGNASANLLPIPAQSITADGYIWYVDNDQLARTELDAKFSVKNTYFRQAADLPKPLLLVQKPLTSYIAGTQVLLESQGGKHE